jgi:sulfoxide reductase heme-binding subunit YedZ
VHGSRIAVWLLRLPLLVPFVLMGPELVAAVRGEPDSVAHLSTSTADVLGTSAFLLFVLMLTITPIHTMTGWRRHLVLRRDYGIGMFAVAATDLTLAATTTGDTFPGGVLSRVGGHSFLVVGTLATLLLIPLALTANRAAQRWLGGYWKTLHRITYVVWALVLVHLLLLFGPTGVFLEATAVSVPLAVLRLPAVRRWWTRERRLDRHAGRRAAAAALVVAVFAAGFAPLVQELAVKGSAAFVQQPIDD